MPQINDAINAAIPNIAGFNNSLNDKLLRYYKTNGAASNSAAEAEGQFLVARGEAVAGTTAMWMHYMGVTKGYTGSFSDMQMAYWTTGPRP